MMKMKKTGAVLAAMALTLGMTANVSAQGNGTVDEAGGTQNITVTGDYVAGTSSDTVYKVDIVWGDMGFTYTDASEGTWNPETHQYDGTTEGSWSWETDANKITVTNHSNAAVEAGLTYEAAEGYAGVTAGFFDAGAKGSGTELNSLSLESAEPVEGATEGAAKEDAAYLQITGGSISSEDDGKNIGTVTVTIEDPSVSE